VADLPHDDRRAAVHGQRLLAEGAVVDRWEDGFDSWKPPRAGSGTPEETGVDLEKESLLRLARELADQRNSEIEHARAELEELKGALRERAVAVAARERELEELQRRLDGGKRQKVPKAPKEPKADPASVEALAARERAALERLQSVEARERELAARHDELEAHASEIAEREQALAAEIDAALREKSQSASERQLAEAERERLEEREQAARRIEKEHATARIDLDRERERLEARAREVEARTRELAGGEGADPYAEREAELRRLELRLAERERDLALMRQGLDSDRNALLERDRALRRRELADARHDFGAPLAPPSFSEGLAAFARGRTRR
jgi:chromosome segregation ATPase